MKPSPKPRVSIGLAVYNGEKYVAETIESILAQTFKDFELIISDNASTDRTSQICQAYAAQDSRIRYFRNHQNLGFAPNYNRVFELSVGHYFKWADHDDLLEPDFLSSAIAILDHHPQVVNCYCKVKIIDEDSQFVTDHDPCPETNSLKRHHCFRNLILAPGFALQSLGLIRRSAIERTILFGSYPSSDEVFLADLALQGQYYELPNRLLKVRFHSEQLTPNTLDNQRANTPFFDTTLTGKIVVPKWWYLWDCLKIIHKADLNIQEWLYCYAIIARWCLIPSRFRALGKDLLLAATQLMARAYVKSKAASERAIQS